MNKYDENYNFRQANSDDIDKIMCFIKRKWRNNHILGNNKDFFLYEHGNEDKLNFIICEDKSTGKMVGMHGFIPYSNSDHQYYHVCAVMIMVSGENLIPMVGVELIKRFISITNYQTYCGIGTNPETMVPLGKHLFGRTTGIMQHYYRLNDLSDYKIAVIKNKKIQRLDNQLNAVLVNVENLTDLDGFFDFEKKYEKLPYKSKKYIEKRYFLHPIYKYLKWKVIYEDETKGLLVGKEITVNGSTIMRIVDYIGDLSVLKYLGEPIKLMLNNKNYEYVDCFSNGLAREDMEQAGFFLLEKEDKNIIPNYFEPFIQKNVEIWFETSEKDMVLFKADADADRPNTCQ
ncbi:hypothetical protein GH808_10380 [Acetobacterium fimetarium]|uniref:Acetyltransferase (GNAT) domain-containing protein n=1 Tax=Acetobacterium fimetarium TaxID=52691 RepID=A0ABR6WW56_9FIRM|nr:hypothetical protein [Acetobacterium fimetarium]MBC3804837.1 hypothetical protein [Acetobacterium fimetarium]